ncbi:MAG: 5'-nucleotidase [Pseudomonadota bacterium]
MVATDSSQRLVVAISSRALFDLASSHTIYQQQGIEAYCQYQISREDEVLPRGVAYSLVRKLLSLNTRLNGKAEVEIVLLSRNSADTGLRVFNSIKHYQLDISRAAFTSGRNPFSYARALGAHLFLSADAADVQHALQSGMAAATIVPGSASYHEESDGEELRIAFDGDAVIFSDEAERIYQEQGLEAFVTNEEKAAKEPLPGGPFKPFLSVLHQIQSAMPADQPLIRTALMTARSAPAHERVIRTLRSWDIRIDEALFLGGMEKGDFLKAFKADIFFDDQRRHCESASQHVPTGHVPQGVTNE